jgi:hypothetical protein
MYLIENTHLRCCITVLGRAVQYIWAYDGYNLLKAVGCRRKTRRQQCDMDVGHHPLIACLAKETLNVTFKFDTLL